MNYELIKASAALARRASPEWKSFMESFAIHVDKCRDEMVSAPPDVLQMAQGRAREGADLLRLFRDCLGLADKLGK